MTEDGYHGEEKLDAGEREKEAEDDAVRLTRYLSPNMCLVSCNLIPSYKINN